MAYLQMDKNPKRELETDEDFLKTAKSCYALAKEFQTMILNCKGDKYLQCMTACDANMAFVCELYMKTVIYLQKKEKRGHYLNELFKKLPSNIREEVKNHMVSDASKRDFDLNLKEISHAFEELRYLFEKPSMAYNHNFLIELTMSLAITIHNNYEEVFED